MNLQKIDRSLKPYNYAETADIETASEDYAMRFAGNIGNYFLSIQTKYALGMLKNYQIKTVLDVGGGHAQLAIPLVKNGYNVTVTGSDASCRKRLDLFLDPNLFDFRICNMLELPFENDSFDSVIAFRLLPHVCHWQSLITEICRVSKKIVMFDYPDIRSFNILYKSMFSIKKKIEGNTRPFTLFSRKQIKRELQRHGVNEIYYHAEYFMPMVVYRMLKSAALTNTLESLFRMIGLTRLLGSPIILIGEKRKPKKLPGPIF